MIERLFPRLRRPRSLLAYAGYIGQEVSWAGARVLANPPLTSPTEDDSQWEVLEANLRRWLTMERRGVPVIGRAGRHSEVQRTDRTGHASFAFSPARFPEAGGWHPVHLEVTEGADGVGLPTPLVASTTALRPAPDAQYAVLSDIDDTILHTNATKVVTMAKLTLMGSARTRKPLPGVAALYRAFQAGAGEPEQARETTEGDHVGDPVRNPIAYISSSPWNLYDMLNEFLEINAIPRGPMLLRDAGLRPGEPTAEGSRHGHKLVKARRFADAWPALPLVLFGDSGQHDADLYASLAEERPERVRAIFIRDVDPDTSSERDAWLAQHTARAEAVDVPMFLIRDSLQAARHAVDLGLLSSRALDGIAQAVQKDHHRPPVGDNNAS